MLGFGGLLAQLVDDGVDGAGVRASGREREVFFVGGDGLLPALELLKVSPQQLVEKRLGVGELRDGLAECGDRLLVAPLLFVDDSHSGVGFGLEAVRLAQRAPVRVERRVRVGERAQQTALDRKSVV